MAGQENDDPRFTDCGADVPTTTPTKLIMSGGYFFKVTE